MAEPKTVSFSLPGDLKHMQDSGLLAGLKPEMKADPKEGKVELTFDSTSQDYRVFAERFRTAKSQHAFLYDGDNNHRNGNEVYLTDETKEQVKAALLSQEMQKGALADKKKKPGEKENLELDIGIGHEYAAAFSPITEKWSYTDEEVADMKPGGLFRKAFAAKIDKYGTPIYFWDKDGDPITCRHKEQAGPCEDDFYWLSEADFNAHFDRLKSVPSADQVVEAEASIPVDTPYGKVKLLNENAPELGYYRYRILVVPEGGGKPVEYVPRTRFGQPNKTQSKDFLYKEVKPGSLVLDSTEKWRPPNDGELKRYLSSNAHLFPPGVSPTLENLYRSSVRITKGADKDFYPVIARFAAQTCETADATLIDIPLSDEEITDLGAWLNIPSIDLAEGRLLLCVDSDSTAKIVKEGGIKKKVRISYPTAALRIAASNLKEAITSSKDGVVYLDNNVEIPKALAEDILKLFEAMLKGDPEWLKMFKNIADWFESKPTFTQLLIGLMMAGILVGGPVLLYRSGLGARLRARGEVMFEELKEKYARKRNFLQEYGNNLTDKARKGRVQKAIGREAETGQALDILGKREISNPLFVGPAGVGKTLLAENIALELLALEPNSEVWQLDIAGMLAGSKYRGMFEERFKGALDQVVRAAQEGDSRARKILKFLKARVRRAQVAAESLHAKTGRRIVLFIDELHTIMGAGKAEGVPMDAANIIKPPMARGEISVIGATTLDEVMHILRDPALARRFDMVFLKPPTKRETLAIIKGIKEGYEKFHGVEYSDAVLARIVEATWGGKFGVPADMELSAEFQRMIVKGQPAAAIDLLDRAGAHLKRKVKKGEVTVGEGAKAQVTVQMIEELSVLGGIESHLRKARGRLEALKGELAWLLKPQDKRAADLDWDYLDALEDEAKGYEKELTIKRNEHDGVLVATDDTGRSLRADDYLQQLKDEAAELEEKIRHLRGTEAADPPAWGGRTPPARTKEGRPKVRLLLDEIEVAQRKLNKARSGGSVQARKVELGEVADEIRPQTDAMDLRSADSPLAIREGESEADYVVRLESIKDGLNKQLAVFDTPPAEANKSGGIRYTLARIQEVQAQYLARLKAPQMRAGAERGKTSWDVTSNDSTRIGLETQGWALEEIPTLAGLPESMQIPSMKADETPQEYLDRLTKEVMPACEHELAQIKEVWDKAYAAEAHRLLEATRSKKSVEPAVADYFRREKAGETPELPPSIVQQAERNVNKWGEVLFKPVNGKAIEKAMTFMPRNLRDHYRSLMSAYREKHGGEIKHVYQLAEIVDSSTYAKIVEELGRNTSNVLDRPERIIFHLIATDAVSAGAITQPDEVTERRFEREMRRAESRPEPGEPHQPVAEAEPKADAKPAAPEGQAWRDAPSRTGHVGRQVVDREFLEYEFILRALERTNPLQATIWRKLNGEGNQVLRHSDDISELLRTLGYEEDRINRAENMIRALELKRGGESILEPMEKVAIYLLSLSTDEAHLRPGEAERAVVSLSMRVRDMRREAVRKGEIDRDDLRRDRDEEARLRRIRGGR